MRIDPQRQEDYRRAYDAWQVQLQSLHQVLLDGGSLEPQRLKGLLSREARAKERYDTARLALLGLGTDGDGPLASVG